MKFHTTIALFILWLAGVAAAADYRVEPLNESAPADEISAAVAERLATSGVTVIRGTKTTFCQIWLCRDLAVQGDFEATPEILYPLTPGQLVGVVRYARKGADFRDQDISSGVYTLRYSQQPVDGAHVGTSLTRDFFLLLPAEHDQATDLLDYDTLTEHSKEAAGSNHPALLAMQRVAEQTKEFPAMRHDEERDWWILGLKAAVEGGRELPLEVTIVGVAVE